MLGLGNSANGSNAGWTWSGPCGRSVRPRWTRRAPGCGWTEPLPSCRREENDTHSGAQNWNGCHLEANLKPQLLIDL